MNKKLQLLVLTVFLSGSVYAQVGIGTTSPDASAALDVSATDKGFLMPRMTTAERTSIASPAAGLQVYDSEMNSVWTFDGTTWKEGSGGAGKFVDGATPDIAFYPERVGVGRNGFSTSHKLYVEKITTDDASQNVAVKVDASFEGGGRSVQNVAVGAVARVNGAGTAGYAIGTQGLVENLNAGGTVEIGAGSWPWINNTGTLAWGGGLVTEIQNNGIVNIGYAQNSSITNHVGASMGQASLGSFYMNNEGSITGSAYGIWIGGAGSGSVGGNAYALYIDTPYPEANVTGDSYAIYSDNTSDSYIEGSLGVGTNAPQQKAHIEGALKLEPQATPPTGGALGVIYVGTDGNLYLHNGTAWGIVQVVFP